MEFVFEMSLNLWALRGSLHHIVFVIWVLAAVGGSDAFCGGFGEGIGQTLFSS